MTQGRALTSAVVGWATAIGLSGLVRTLWLAVLLLALAGAADLVSAVYRQTPLRTYTPDEMRGRMQGVFTVVVTAVPGWATCAREPWRAPPRSPWPGRAAPRSVPSSSSPGPSR